MRSTFCLSVLTMLLFSASALFGAEQEILKKDPAVLAAIDKISGDKLPEPGKSKGGSTDCPKMISLDSITALGLMDIMGIDDTVSMINKDAKTSSGTLTDFKTACKTEKEVTASASLGKLQFSNHNGIASYLITKQTADRIMEKAKGNPNLTELASALSGRTIESTGTNRASKQASSSTGLPPPVSVVGGDGASTVTAPT